MGGVSAHKLDAHGSWQGELCAVFNLSKDYCSTSITLIVFFCSYDSPFPHSNTVHHSGGLISLAFMRLLLFIGWNVIEVVLYTPTEVRPVSFPHPGILWISFVLLQLGQGS